MIGDTFLEPHQQVRVDGAQDGRGVSAEASTSRTRTHQVSTTLDVSVRILISRARSVCKRSACLFYRRKQYRVALLRRSISGERSARSVNGRGRRGSTPVLLRVALRLATLILSLTASIPFVREHLVFSFYSLTRPGQLPHTPQQPPLPSSPLYPGATAAQ